MKFKVIAPALAMALLTTALLAGIAGTPEEAVAQAKSAANDAAKEVDAATVKRLSDSLSVPGMDLEVQSVTHSEIAGVYQVQFANGPLVYASPTGEFFIVGDMYTVQGGTYVNLAERRRDGQRAQQLAALDPEDMIVFSPEGETRSHITVFTDVTCFYCQKLHQEVPELNRRGVEVRYLAYPRAGVDSDGFRQLASAWCSDTPQETLTRLKNRESVPPKSCDNPIVEQYQLGQAMGVRGTPAIITEEGQMIPGYQSADELMVSIGLADAAE